MVPAADSRVYLSGLIELPYAAAYFERVVGGLYWMDYSACMYLFGRDFVFFR